MQIVKHDNKALLPMFLMWIRQQSTSSMYLSGRAAAMRLRRSS